MKTIYASKTLLLKRIYISLFIFPFFLYGFMTTINNVFGVDLAGGLLGDREPVGAGYTLLIGSPVYIYYFAKWVWEFFLTQAPAYLEITQSDIKIFLPERVEIPWSGLDEIFIDKTKYDKSLIIKYQDKKIKISIDHLDIEEKELMREILQYAPNNIEASVQENNSHS